jgi:hypothetical protein
MHLLGTFIQILLAVVFLTGIMVLLGWAAGWICNSDASDRFSLALVLVVRNVAIATTSAETVLVRLEFPVFATASCFDRVPIRVVVLRLLRMTRFSKP